MKAFFLFFILSSFSLVVFPQKTFSVEIHPSNITDIKKFIIYVDNGKSEISPDINYQNGIMKFSGVYFGEYAQILIRYPRKDAPDFYEISTFFVGELPGVIQFKPAKSNDSIISNYTLRNVKDFVGDKLQMNKYDSEADKRFRDFYIEHADSFSSDSVLLKRLMVLDNDVFEKKLEYIVAHTDSYYAFSFFRRNFVNIRRLPSDSVLNILSTFPDRFKNSIEGDAIRSLVNGRESVKLNGYAPDFKSKSVVGEEISLQQSLESGYVLLDFWATWCGPCLHEMPELEQIYKQYKDKGLTVISIAYPSTYEQALEYIKEYNMKWINIYDDTDLINAYGGSLPIPRIYLIDKNRKILFDRNQEQEENYLERLKKLLASLITQ